MKQTTKTVPTRMGLQSLWGAVERLSLTLIFVMLTTAAWAETINGVSYIDENGETQTADNVTVLTGNEEPSDNGTIDLTPGWYVVNSTVNYTRSVTMETMGEYHIILADGGKMNIGSSANPIYNDGDNNNPRGIDGSHPLYIYGQTNGRGADGSGLRATNNVTINGGVITARATCDLGGTESFGIKAFHRVIINGGQVTAWGSNKGVCSSSGSISLSWKKITDFIDVNSYYCYSSLTIATGKVFTDGNGSYYIEANASEVLALTNTRLMPTQDYKGYSVVFDSNGGSDVPTQIVLGGFTVTEPTAPTKAGKVFCGWYLDNGLQTAYDFTSVVTGNLTLYAKWADAISYNLRDALIQRVYRYTGRVVTPVVRNNAAQLLTAGTDYTVTGATQMVQPGVYTLTVTGKGSYMGSQTVSVRVLTFDKSDGTNLVTNCTLPANNSNAVVVSSADSTMQSACWYVVSEDATVAKRISVNGDVNLVLCDGATLTAELGISVTDGNSLTIYSQSGNTGTLVAEVPDRVNVYHAAIGGDRDKLKSSPVKAGTITIHGGVINAAAHSLTEDIGAAHDGEAGTINIYGGKITTSGSHDTGIGGIGATVHLGWCRESSDFIESQGYSGTVVFDKNFVIDGTSIVATQKNIAGKKIVPTAKTLCTVTFQTNGGSIVDALHLFSGTTVPEPDIPFRAGYQFAGWYTNDGCTDPYDFNTAVDHSFTLYAKWDNVAPISYIDADGHTVTGFTAYTPMENSYTELPEGTYFVGKNTTVSSRIELSGTVNLILGDGATLTAEQGIHVAQHNTLNIFAQSAGTGTLTASADYHNAAIGATHEDDQMGMNHSGIIRIYGGVITANGSSGASAIGGSNVIDNGAIYIYGGTITATTDGGAVIGCGKTNGGIISILGGKITATNKYIYGYGIGGPNATIHLDLRKASDFIHASGYMGTVNIKSGLLFTDGTNIYSGNNVSIPNNVTLTQANFTDDGNNSYTIHNAAGWDVCCDALQDNATYNRFIGKTVYLANDITVTRMAGSDYHDFCGTFDGQGNTITLDLDSNKGGYALFRNAVGATIKNLHVDGTIVTAGKYAAGLISGKWGDITIENCRSSVTIKSSVGGDGTHGGFVAVSNNGELNIKGCVFDGKIVSTGASATTYCGGFVGWRGGGDLNISNSLYAPAEIKSDETEISSECTFARNGVTNITNTYYTRTLSVAQGKAAHSITAGENVSVGHAGVAKTYSVSGITAYKASGASNDDDPFIAGIVYNDVLYAGDGDEVSLTLSNSVPMPGKGYQYAYTASTGTLSGSTLTMPADDVTVNVALETITYNITYHLDGGSVATDNPATYNVETETFTLNNPTKPDHIFIGWTGSNDSTPQTTVTITKGSLAENLEYTANYVFADFSQGDLSYEWTSETEVKVTFCDRSATMVTIPTTVSNDGRTYSVTSIGEYAFYYCSSLESIEIPASVTSVGEAAFLYCTNLASVTIYASELSVYGRNAFSENASGRKIYVPSEYVESYKSGWSDYASDIVGFDGKCGDNVYYAYDNDTKTLNIFGTGAMEDYSNSMDIPWYSNRENIKKVVVSDGVTGIGNDAFYCCTSLESIEIPASVTSIGNYAFQYCTSLNSIEIPVSVTTIGDGAFDYCTGLTSIEIPANVTLIGSNPFSGCSGLKTISVASRNTVFDSRNNCNAIVKTKTNTLITGCKNSVIPASVTNIGQRAFDGCTDLTSIEIPAGVTTIGETAFYGCTGLTSIEIPAGMTDIGNDAFRDCSGLTSVTIYAPSLTTYGNNAFANNGEGRKIYVFSNSLTTYKEHASWMCVDNDDIQAITLRFYESTENGDAIDAFAALCNGENKIDVTLQGRTLYKDGDWNTLCLPFDVTIEGSVLDGADVRALADANLTDDVLTLNFTKEGEVSKIEAGKPYIIKWKEGENLVSPVFTGVTVDATTHNFRSEDGKVYFKGTYAPLSWNAENQSILFLGAGNELNWPLAGARLNAFRAYFELDPNAHAREFVMNFDGGSEETGIISLSKEPRSQGEADAWYTVNGVKLDGRPTAKGMYIRNGKKVVIK